MASPIQRIMVPVDIGRSTIDTYTDAKVLETGVLTEAQNIVYNRDGVMSRRYGVAPLGALTTPSAADKLLVRNEQLAAYTRSDGTLSRYDAASGRWVSDKVGYLPVPWVTAKPVGPSSSAVSAALYLSGYSVDVASNSSVTNGTELAIAYVTTSSLGTGSNATIDFVDAFTGVLKQTISITGPFSDVRIAYNYATTDYLVAVNTATSAGVAGPIKVYKIRSGTTGSTLVWTSSTNAVGGDVGFDFCFLPQDGMYPVLYCAALNTVTLGFLSWNGASYVSTTSLTTTAAGSFKGMCIARSAPLTGNGFKCFISGSGAGGTKGFFASTTAAITTALFTVSANTDVTTACQDDSGNVYLSQKSATNTTARYKITSAASVSALDSFYAGTPVSALQLDQTQRDTCYQWMVYSDPQVTQPCFFLARLGFSAGLNDHQPIGRAFYGKAVNFNPVSLGTPSIVDFTQKTGNQNALCTVLQTAPFISVGTYDLLKTSLNLVAFGLDPASGWQTAEVAQTTYVTGGYLAKYDGAAITENGFLLAPQKPTLAAIAGTGSFAAGTYLVAVLFEEEDAQGRLHRSAPSLIASITLAGGAGSSQFTVSLPSYAATGPSKQMRIAFYCSQANLPTLYRSPGAVAMTATGGTITATLVAAPSATNEQLYTLSGIVENYQPSAPLAITIDQNRAYVLEGDSLQRVSISKRLLPGNALAFMASYYRSVESGTSEIVGLTSLLGRKIVFKKRGIFVAAGDGADDTLAADTLSQFETVSYEYGATDAESIVSTQEGVVFRSQKGWYLLGRDMTIRYVGANVDTYAPLTNKYQFAQYNRDAGEIVWLSQSATPALLRLTMFRDENGMQYRWTTGTLNGQSAVRDMTFWGGPSGSARQVMALGLNSSSGGSLVASETLGVYSDAAIAPAVHVPQLITTGWIKPNAITGFGRLYGIYVLGSSYSSHQFNVDIAYDYEMTWAETKVISSVNATIGGSAYLFVVRPSRTRCTAFRLRIYDSAYTNAAKDTYDLSGLLLDVGVYQGPARLRAEKKI